jgi:hypothetical protein
MEDALKDPIAEQDAQTIAKVWADDGKDAAMLKFKEIADLRDMKILDAVIMLDRITAILCVSNFTIR